MNPNINSALTFVFALKT